MLTTLAISNYRSVREMVMPLARLTLVTGANGSGKSNVYRGLRLLAEVAQGGIVSAIAREGGLSSTLWAGPERVSRSMKQGIHPVEGTQRQASVALRLGFTSDDFGYAIDMGMPSPSRSAFALDPEIKNESVWAGAFLRPAALLVERRGPRMRCREPRGGGWTDSAFSIAAFDSMLAQFPDPARSPEMYTLRENIRRWRFYDHFRTDADAPARQARPGTHTPILHHDGSDLAAALQTIAEIGDAAAIQDAVDDAFPGSRLTIRIVDGRFDVELYQEGLLRPLRAAELSDGTLRYLLWIAALLSPRPPELLVLNEPEASLHPDLLPALAKLIRAAATRSQVIVVSHASRLIASLEEDAECVHHHLAKDFGETGILGLHPLEQPAWYWPKR